MLFNSYTFIVFFIIVLILHNLPFSWKTKEINLLIASYVFYAAWNPPFILLLWLSTVVDFFVGRALYTQENKHKKKLLLVISLIGNLGMLCFFKYGGFLLENFTFLVNALGFNYHPAKPNIILPAGISFYTFTTLCYTIDMYKKKSKPVESMLDFSLFVTFFPHLVAGPIVRPPQLVPQFQTPRKANAQQLVQGLFLLSLGLFMKVFLADGMLSGPANTVFGSQAPLQTADAWLGVLAFSGQIFFDFAGYSSCAIGAALCLGFVLPQNFLFPYAAVGFTDFWRRWHITLSSWLRDYLYIPLGGNRLAKYRTYAALMMTMLLGGLWHGANWTFVAWGGLHGVYLAAERALRARFTNYRPGPLAFVALGLLTYTLVNVTWVFFRAKTFSKAWIVLRGMFGQNAAAKPILTTFSLISVAAIVGGIVLTHWLMRARTLESVVARAPAVALCMIWALLAFAIVIAQGAGNAFIYFQF